MAHNISRIGDFATRGKKAWHGLGNIFPMDKLISADEMMQLSSTGFKVIKAQNHIRNPFGVDVADFLRNTDLDLSSVSDLQAQLPSLIQSYVDQRFQAGESFTTIRNDDYEGNGEAYTLGTVGDRYSVFQNYEMYNFLEQFRNAANGYVQYETAGALKGGRIVFVTAKINQDLIVGDDDRTEQYLVITNSHDGFGTLKILWTPIRVVCNNTLTWAINSANAKVSSMSPLKGNYVSIKHTTNMRAALKPATDFLGLVLRSTETIQGNMELFQNTRMTDLDYSKFLVNMFVKDQEALKSLNAEKRSILTSDLNNFEISTQTKNRFNAYQTMRSQAPGQKGNEGNWWGGINAFQYGMSHIEGMSSTKTDVQVSESNFMNLYVGTAKTGLQNRAFQYAQKQVLELA